MPQNDVSPVARKFLKRDCVVIEGRAGVGAAFGVGHGALTTPALAVVYEDDTKQIVEVRCDCGKKIRIVCQYGMPPKGVPYDS